MANIKTIGHYSLENPASVYDEEAITALELAGRTAAKVNECINQVNENTEALPGMVADTVQEHIDGGAFNEQIDTFAGDIKDQVEANDKKQTTNLANEVATLSKRINNIVSNPGNGSTPTELVDARTDGLGNTHASLFESLQTQSKQASNIHQGLVYLGSNSCVDLTVNNDGTITIKSVGRLTYRGYYGTKVLEWAECAVNIPTDKITYITDKTVEITLPTYHSFVYNVKDKLYYFRNHAVCEPFDIPLVQNGYGNPYKGVLVDEWKYRNLVRQKADMFVVNGAYIYQGSTGDMVFTPNNTKETLDVYFIGRLTWCWRNDNKVIEWDLDGSLSEIKDHVTVESSTRVTISIPGWNALVYNINDNKYHLRWRANMFEGDIPAIMTGYLQLLGGTLVSEWNAKQSNKFLAYLEGSNIANVIPDSVKTYAGQINGTDKFESFLFFTDPHLCEGTDWETEFQTYKDYLEGVYASTPATFALCGGDWLGNSDTVEQACFKLAFIDKQMHSIFDRYYPMVGNHDTNYQGKLQEGDANYTGQLSTQTIKNLWFRDQGKAYYRFQGEHTDFLVLDSGLDNRTSLDAYDTEQLIWMCNELITSPAENMAVALHIYYDNGTADENIAPLARAMSDIAGAFNARTSYNLSDRTFDFSGASGKIRFILAGHRHGDTLTTAQGIPLVVTADTRHGGQPTFELVLVDYDNNKLSLTRVGSGVTRTADI